MACLRLIIVLGWEFLEMDTDFIVCIEASRDYIVSRLMKSTRRSFIERGEIFETQYDVFGYIGQDLSDSKGVLCGI